MIRSASRQRGVLALWTAVLLPIVILLLALVILVLALFMGWRAAVVVGTTLLLTVVGTLFFMAIFSM